MILSAAALPPHCRRCTVLHQERHCHGCRTRWSSGWYEVNGHLYCADCRPKPKARPAPVVESIWIDEHTEPTYP